jgi:hypothetical protein
MALYENTPPMVTNGLVLALDAANIRSYTGTGTTWTDLSGNNNNGTLVNSPTFSSTNGGNLSFNGTTQNISLPSSLTRLNTNYSIGMWFLPTRVFSSYLTSDWSSTGRNYLLAQDVTNNKIALIIGNGSTSQDTTLQSNLALTTNAWNNVTFVVNGTTRTIYMNGVFDKSAVGSYSGGVTSNLRNIATSNDRNAADFFQGNIATTQFYNRALTAAEVQQNYNALKNRFNLK